VILKRSSTNTAKKWIYRLTCWPRAPEQLPAISIAWRKARPLGQAAT
jgi:hypothetical protein